MMFLLLALVSLAATVISAGWEPLSPEGMRFIFTRCQEDNFHQNYTKAKLWQSIVFPKDDADTACYVKCILTMTDQFDKETNAFKADHVKEQYEAYKSYTNLAEEDVLAYEKDLNELGTVEGGECTGVFNKFMQIYEKQKNVVHLLLLADYGVAAAIYNDNPDIKKKGDSTFRHCEKKYFKDDPKKLCELRKTGTTDHPKLIEHEDCILKGLRYSNPDGSLNADEILRDFHLANINNADEQVREAVSSCSKEANSPRLSCLFKHGDLASSMWKATDYREVRSMDYFYLLKEDHPEYDQIDMRKKVCAIDAEIGCESGKECAF